MTNAPRYSPPPQQPGYRPAPKRPAPPAYAQGHQQPYNQPFEWRYQPSQQSQPQPTQTAQFRQPYGPFSGTGPGPIPGGIGRGRIPGGTGAGPIPGGTGATGPIPRMLPPIPLPPGP